MGYLYSLPKWFIIYSIGFEFVFAFITLLVAIYAYKIYRISCQNEHKLFSLGFFSISFSYVMWFLLNLSALFELNESTSALNITNAINYINLGAYAYMIFFLVGLVILTYITLKVDSNKTLALISSIIFLSIFLASNKGSLFYSFSAILVLFLGIHYFMEYLDKRNPRLAVMLAAFIFLFLGMVDLLLTSFNSVYFVVGHLFMVISFVLILFNLMSALKNGKKKK